MKLPAISWKHVAVFVCIFTPLGMAMWVIHTLSDTTKWCAILVNAGKIAGTRQLAQDCTPVLLALVPSIANIGYICCIGSMLGALTWTVMNLGARLSFRGPAGFGGEVGGDDEPPAVQIKQPADNPIPVEQQ